jgi:signal transduction histidine kinase
MDEQPRDFDLAELAQLGFAASKVPQVVVDRGWRILMASDGAGRLLERSRESLVGLPLGRVVSNLDVFGCTGDRACPDDGCFRELELTTSRGQLRPAEVHCQQFSDTAGRTFINLVLHDTAELEARDAMRSARMAKLSLLNQLSEALYGAHLSLEQVLEAVLIAMTAGQGLRFNRAFLLLIDEKRGSLRGEIAIGPSSRDEAARIWTNLADQTPDLFEMMTSYDRSLKETDVAVNEIVRRLEVSLAEADSVLVRSMFERRVVHVTDGDNSPGVDVVRGWLGVNRFAVAPLATRQGPLGVLIADNSISDLEITPMDLEFLQLFANQSANAIENSRLTQELAQKVRDLHRAHQKQKEDQQTLLRMERLSVMGETSAIVAHELRNPLVAIGGFARSLLRGMSEDDPNREFTKIITDEVDRLERIIHDLLDFIRPQKMMRRFVPVDRIVDEVLNKMKGQCQEGHVVLERDLQAGAAEASCHPGEIQQVVQNLIVNAIQAQPEGGRLVVHSRALEGGILVQIEDQGPGFARDVAEKMFTPFFTTKTTGSGLGLTICAQIIKAHGGVLRAENRTEGGARMSFILPLPRSDGDVKD